MSKNPKKNETQAKELSKGVSSLFTLSSEAKIKVSLWQLATLPLKKAIDNWKNLFYLGIPTAILLSVVSLLLKRGILCSQNEDMALISSFCSNDALLFYTDILIRFVIVSFFAVVWYNVALQKKECSILSLLKIKLSYLKTFGLIVLAFIINISPIFALFLLIIRTPNPDWRIELLYFTSVAWIFLLPIIALRFYSVIAFSLAEKKIPAIKQIWNNSSGNMLKILLATSVLVFLALFLFMQYYASIQGLTDIGIWTAFVAEFEYNVLVMIFMALMVNYCYTQKELLFGGNLNDE